MTIIRGGTIFQVSLLTQTGELLPVNSEGSADFVRDEQRAIFQTGEKSGYVKALEESRVFLNLLQTVARKILEQKNRLLDQLKPEIVEFAIAICERVIRKELAQPQALVRLINSLLISAIPSMNTDTIHIILSPEDYILLEKNFHQIQYDKREIEGVRFVADPLMRRGDCRIEAKSGLLNYDIARELEELQAKVLQH